MTPTPALFEVEVVEKEERRLGWRGQLFGPPPRWGRTRVLSSPRGNVRLTRENRTIVASGDSVPRVSIRIDPPVNMASVGRGITGLVDAEEVRIVRPRFGLRRRDRSVFVDGAGLELRTEYRRSRRWELVRRDDGSLVYRRTGTLQVFDRDASGAEVAMALALEDAGVFATHSLVNYLTL